MQLGEFNALDAVDARRSVDACLGVDRWVDEVVRRRPYDDLGALLDQARSSAQSLTDDELATALTRHPRIGERPPPEDREAAMAGVEQSGVDAADSDTAARLRDGNRAYEERFDRVFLIRAAGRDGAQILAELGRRLHNDEETERDETVSELRQIALLRLHRVVGE